MTYNDRLKPFVILGLGNDLLGDDAAGLLVIQQLNSNPDFFKIQDFFDTVLCSESGVTLLDYLSGYQKAIVVDSVCSPNFVVGTSFEIPFDSLRPVQSPSPHYSGLTELQQLAKELNIPFPVEIRVIGISVEDPYTIGKPLSETTSLGVKSALTLCLTIAEDWVKQLKSTHHSVQNNHCSNGSNSLF